MSARSQEAGDHRPKRHDTNPVGNKNVFGVRWLVEDKVSPRTGKAEDVGLFPAEEI